MLDRIQGYMMGIYFNNIALMFMLSNELSLFCVAPVHCISKFLIDAGIWCRFTCLNYQY